MMKKTVTTNVTRLLAAKKIDFTVHDYVDSGAVAGQDVAAALGENPDDVFKTLVTVGKSGGHYVFVVPVAKELDLKKAARAVGEKHVEMIKSRDLLPLTGYVHGGCSPIGMKKELPTVIDASAADRERIFFSGGKIGCQVELRVCDLPAVLNFRFEYVTD